MEQRERERMRSLMWGHPPCGNAHEKHVLSLETQMWRESLTQSNRRWRERERHDLVNWCSLLHDRNNKYMGRGSFI